MSALGLTESADSSWKYSSGGVLGNRSGRRRELYRESTENTAKLALYGAKPHLIEEGVSLQKLIPKGQIEKSRLFSMISGVSRKKEGTSYGDC